MIEMAWTRLTILKIRPIRSVRSRVPRILRSTPVSILRMIYTTQVPMTTMKSKMFHISLKYFFFKAISLIIASIVKITEKIQFIISMQNTVSSLQLYHFMANKIVLPIIMTMMNWSNFGFYERWIIKSTNRWPVVLIFKIGFAEQVMIYTSIHFFSIARRRLLRLSFSFSQLKFSMTTPTNKFKKSMVRKIITKNPKIMKIILLFTTG